MSLINLTADPVSILRAKSYTVVLNVELSCFLTFLLFITKCTFSSLRLFILSSTHPIKSAFCVCNIFFFFFWWNIFHNHWYDRWKIVFFWFPWQKFLGKQIPSSSDAAFPSLKNGVKQIKYIQEKKPQRRILCPIFKVTVPGTRIKMHQKNFFLIFTTIYQHTAECIWFVV